MGKRSNYRRSLLVQACDLQFEEVFMTKAFKSSNYKSQARPQSSAIATSLTP